jgi:hypothetical protein
VLKKSSVASRQLLSIVTIDHSVWPNSQLKSGGILRTEAIKNRDLIEGPCICVISSLMRWTGRQRRQVYEQLAGIEPGFEQAARALRVFGKFRGFERSEIERSSELTAEARAATLSYLTNIIEIVETEEAGRLQGPAQT